MTIIAATKNLTVSIRVTKIAAVKISIIIRSISIKFNILLRISFCIFISVLPSIKTIEILSHTEKKIRYIAPVKQIIGGKSLG